MRLEDTADQGAVRARLSKQDVGALFRIIDWMMDLPKVVTQQFWQELEQYEKEKQVPYITSVERLGMERGNARDYSRGSVRDYSRGNARDYSQASPRA